ncbi:hypothetical protein C0991_007658, partial [Blastosporella zonata]
APSSGPGFDKPEPPKAGPKPAALGRAGPSTSLFTPFIVVGLGYNNANAQLLSVPPFAMTFV